MKPAPFAYHAPDDVDDVVSLLAEHGDEAKILAGGQSLVPLLALRLARFEALIDVNRVAALSGVEQRNGHLSIGAATRQAVLERDPVVARCAPLVAEGTRLIGHFQIRNRGTLGGSLAHADPAAEYPAIALALDAELDVASPRGRRTIGADDLLDSAYVTALEPDELIVSVRFPVAAARTGHAIEEVARRHGDFALAGAAVVLTVDGDDRIALARVAVFGLGERAVRLRALEERLTEGALDLDDAADELAAAVDALTPPTDVQATAQYRKAVAGPLIRRALEHAHARATAES